MLSLQILLILCVISAVAGRGLQSPEAVKGDPQDGIAIVVHSAIIDLFGIAAKIKAVHFIPGQKPLFDQLLQVDEIGIARKGGDRLIGGVPETGLAQGQDLPVRLAGFLQEVHELIGFFGKRADAET